MNKLQVEEKYSAYDENIRLIYYFKVWHIKVVLHIS